MSLPTEARDGLMRAWLEVLHQRHPDVTWVPATKTERRPAQSRATKRTQPRRQVARV